MAAIFQIGLLIDVSLFYVMSLYFWGPLQKPPTVMRLSLLKMFIIIIIIIVIVIVIIFITLGEFPYCGLRSAVGLMN